MEHRLYEGAVMVAYAMHLLRTTSATYVRIHLDGEHGKQFDNTGCLLRRGFEKASSMGTKSYGGLYRKVVDLIHDRSGSIDLRTSVSSSASSGKP